VLLTPAHNQEHKKQFQQENKTSRNESNKKTFIKNARLYNSLTQQKFINLALVIMTREGW
jgi:hypothetical protein